MGLGVASMSTESSLIALESRSCLLALRVFLAGESVFKGLTTRRGEADSVVGVNAFCADVGCLKGLRTLVSTFGLDVGSLSIES